jgi:alginate O-acetyltransferase complex protein AlgJ
VPYKDHVLTLHLVDVEGVDTPVQGNQAIVYMWSMRDNELTRAARYREGEELTLGLKSWNDVGEEYEAINRSDLDDEDLQLQDPNWGEEGTEMKIEEAVRKTAAATVVAATVVAATVSMPLQSTAEEGSFLAECGKRAAVAAESEEMAVEGRDGWKFLGKELRHISVGKFWGDAAADVSRASKPEWADPIPAIIDFYEQLDKAGIKLILAPVPPKAIVYPDMLVDGAVPEPRLDVHLQEFYKLLTEKGVKVIDVTGALIAARAEAGPALYCKTDTHYSPRACEMIAELVKKEIGDPEWLTGAASEGFETSAGTRDINGDLGGTETLAVKVVRGKEGGATTDRASPVILLGDSHCLVFSLGGDMHGAEAGLADQLAAELGIPVDLLGVRGSGATPARLSLMRRAAGDEAYMAGKKVVVWCFTAREFTESQGWRKVPVIR